MSFFDNMMNPNGQNKNASKNNGKAPNGHKQQVRKDDFTQEVGEEFSVRRAAKENDFQDQPQDVVSEANKNAFKEEFSDDMMNEPSQFGIQSYSKAGVTFEKLSETQARVNYSGLLAKSGAQEIFGVYGFGSNQNWENVTTVALNNQEGSFMSIIPVEQGKNINLAFKDSGENWDNNSGMNYTFVN